ncbi:MAG: hypothetical protein KC535_02815 [Nanoarchaeota archaeon]|nr:hypothetical protein [Nanoarchaeota archaeon]
MSRYGIIGGISKPEQVKTVLERYFDPQGIDIIIVNGDLSSQVPQHQVKSHLETVFSILGKSGKPIFVQPGLQDRIATFEPAIFAAQKKYQNIIDTRLHFNLQIGNHSLLFVPGHENTQSDYVFGDNYLQSSIYKTDQTKWIKTDLVQNSPLDTNLTFYYSLQNISRHINNPEHTILISPYPRRFYNTRCIDTLFYLQTVTGEMDIPEDIQNKIGYREYYQEVKDLLKDTDYGFIHAGSKLLEEFLDQFNITKSISSNPTINSQFATTSKGAPCTDKKFHSDIHYNTGRLEDGLAGAIYIQDDQRLGFVNIDMRRRDRENVFTSLPLN